MTGRGLPRYLISVRASAVARSSGSYNSTAHAPTRIQFVKLAGACNGSSFSPARKLLRLSFAGSSFIKWYTVFRSLPPLRTVFPSKIEILCASPDSLRGSPHASACNGFRVGAANLAGFGFHAKTFAATKPPPLTAHLYRWNPATTNDGFPPSHRL